MVCVTAIPESLSDLADRKDGQHAGYSVAGKGNSQTYNLHKSIYYNISIFDAAVSYGILLNRKH